MLPSVLSTCVLIESSADSDPDSPEMLVRNCNLFTVRYFKHCYKPTENTLCSPVTVRLDLAHFYQTSGAAIDEDLRTLLNLPNDKPASTAQQKQLLTGLVHSGALKTHTMVCTAEDRPLDETLQDHLITQTPVVVEPVDFSDDVLTARAVNSWIQSKRCEIDDLILEGDVWSLEPVSLMMFDAVSLMTIWKARFDPNRTVPKEFRFLNKTQTIPTMHGTFQVWYCYDQQLKCKIVELPFEPSSAYTLLAILPDEEQVLEDVVKTLPCEYLNLIDTTMTNCWVDIQIPSFTVAMKSSVKDVLTKLDYAGIFEVKDLKVFADGKDLLDRFYQHCYFHIDESGIDSPGLQPGSPQISMVVDRPFLFVVRKVDDNVAVMVGDYSIYVDPDEQF